MITTDNDLEKTVEAVLFAAGKPMNAQAILAVFPEEARPELAHIKDILVKLQGIYQNRGIVLAELATGYSFQTVKETAHVVSRLWEEKPARYSRALLETLALIAYRQPITRGEIEDIRGVATNPQIIRTLMEHDFIRVVGHKEVPGKPALLATTKQFLTHFNLKDLEDLPQLAEVTDLEKAARTLANEAQGDLFEQTAAVSEEPTPAPTPLSLSTNFDELADEEEEMDL